MSDLTTQQKAALTEDANNRAVRTFVVQLGIDILVAIVMVLATTFGAADDWSALNWQVLGFSLVKTVIATIGAFVMRRFLDNTSLPTPLPPTPVPEPAAPAEEAA